MGANSGVMRAIAAADRAADQILEERRLARLTGLEEELNPIRKRLLEAQASAAEGRPELLSAQAAKQQSAALESQTKATLFQIDPADVTDEELAELSALARMAIRTAKRRGEQTVSLPATLVERLGAAETRSRATVESARIRTEAREEVNKALAELLRARAAAEPQKVRQAGQALAVALKKLDIQELQLIAPTVQTVIETIERDEFGDPARRERTTTTGRDITITPPPGTGRRTPIGGPVDLRAGRRGPIQFQTKSPTGKAGILTLTIEQAEALKAQGWKVTPIGQ